MCKVIIIKVLQRIFGLWFHEITHICNIYLLNPTSLANQEMLISTMILVWNGSKNYLRWGAIIFHPIWAFFLIEICRKTLILGPRWFTKSNGYALLIFIQIENSFKCAQLLTWRHASCAKSEKKFPYKPKKPLKQRTFFFVSWMAIDKWKWKILTIRGNSDNIKLHPWNFRN